MTQEERTRIKVIQMAVEKRITQKTAAGQLEISERHFRRLLCRYRHHGDAGLVLGHREKPSNNRMKTSKRQTIVDFMQNFNCCFAVILRCQLNEHRLLLPQDGLAQILTCQEIRILLKKIDYTVYHKQAKQSEIVSAKDVDGKVDKIRKFHKPAPDHPWCRSFSSPLSVLKGDILTLP